MKRMIALLAAMSLLFTASAMAEDHAALPGTRVDAAAVASTPAAADEEGLIELSDEELLAQIGRASCRERV